MEIYISLFFLLILIGLYSDKEIITYKKKYIINTKLFLTVFSILLFLISATRIGIGTDYHLYEVIYENSLEKFLGLGWGYEWLSQFFRLLGADYQVLIIMNSLIFICSIIYFIFYFSDYKYISLIVFLGTYSYFASFNIFRQSTSIALVLLALVILNKHSKKILTGILFIISLGIHKSSIIFLPFFFLKYVKFSRIFYLTILILCLVSFFIIPESFKILFFDKALSFNEFFSQKYSGTVHVEGIARSLTNRIFYLFYWIMAIKLIINMNNISSKNKWIIQSFLFYFIINSFFPYSNLVNRISLFFELLAIYIIPKFISEFHSVTIRNILKIAIILVFFVRVLYVLNLNGDGVVPYKSIFW